MSTWHTEKTQERCSVRMLGHMMGVQNKIDKMQVAWRLALIIMPTYSQCRSTALCQRQMKGQLLYCS